MQCLLRSFSIDKYIPCRLSLSATRCFLRRKLWVLQLPQWPAAPDEDGQAGQGDVAETDAQALPQLVSPKPTVWTPNGAPAEKFYVAQGWRLDGRREWHPWVGLEMVGYSKALS